jgi:hypothetical protein
MKRIYIKPEIKTLQLHLKAFITAGSGPNNNPDWNMGEEGGGGNGSDIGNGGPNDLSRSWGRGMWDDMD